MLVTRRIEIEAPNMVLLMVLCAGVPIMALNGKSRVYGNRPRQVYKERTMKRESKHLNLLRFCAVLVVFAFSANVVSAKTLKVF